MSFKERNIIAYLTSMVLIFSVYGWVVSGMVSAGRFDGPDALALLAQCILVLVVATIAVTFVMVIAFNIVLTKIKGDQEDETAYMMDERDRMIELRSLKLAHFLTGTGVVLAMVVLAMGGSAFLVFHLVMFSFAGADIIASLVQFRQYRRGA
jgi:hypothetical protein